MPSPKQALEAFADPAQNPDLLRLESLLSRFNLFEAIGVLRQELRHSDLLAALLDPSQHHGLKTIFLKELLQVVLATADDESEVTRADLDLWDLGQAVVSRESHRIDILVLDEVNCFAVIIENKIDSGERTGQLSRYYDDVRNQYPDYKVLAIYLTRDGNAPTFDRYHAISYTQVCQIIEKILEDHCSTLGNDIVVLLEHYAQILRRHIMSDSGVADLCRSIYQKHKQALDLIFEHRPDQQEDINEYAKSLIANEASIKPCFSKKSYIQFNPVAWDGSPSYQGQYPMCPWFLYFQFNSDPDNLLIALLMTPGNRSHRERLFEVAQANNFPGCPATLTRLKGQGGWSRLYEKTQEEIEQIISRKWAEFLRDDLPNITLTIRNEEWLWVPQQGEVYGDSSDQCSQIGHYIISLVLEDQRLKLYNCDSKSRSWINFTLAEWDAGLKYRQFLTNYAIFPFFAFDIRSQSVTLGVLIGTPDQADRNRMLQIAKDCGMSGVPQNLNRKEWSPISAFNILSPDDFCKPQQEIEDVIKQRWSEFLSNELPLIQAAVRQEEWLWTLP